MAGPTGYSPEGGGAWRPAMDRYTRAWFRARALDMAAASEFQTSSIRAGTE